MHTELMKKLETIAYDQSKPFCYGCYHEVPTSHCKSCFSDDLMRLVPGVGVEWGTEWVIEHLISANLIPVNVDEAFEEMMTDCYDETTKVGWMDLDTITVMKTMDPICWDIAQSEWADNEREDGNFISFDNGCTYYLTSDVEEYCDQYLPSD